MTPIVRGLIAGNWKMNGHRAALGEAREAAEALARAPAAVRVGICPPSTLVMALAEAMAGTDVLAGAQDCSQRGEGAFTGDVSAAMIADAGARLVILGHSERRALHGEDDALVAAKACAAVAAGLEPIVCVGETLEERRAGLTLEVVARQVLGSLPDELARHPFDVAYEPVWAIGTGLTPTLEEIEQVHLAIRALLVEHFEDHGANAPILYGGSVKPANAAEILAAAEVGGALVGGASLKAADFLPIIRAAG